MMILIDNSILLNSMLILIDNADKDLLSKPGSGSPLPAPTKEPLPKPPPPSHHQHHEEEDEDAHHFQAFESTDAEVE